MTANSAMRRRSAIEPQVADVGLQVPQCCCIPTDSALEREIVEVLGGRFMKLTSRSYTVDRDVTQLAYPMQKIALRLVPIGGTGALAQATHALHAFVDVPAVFAARGESFVESFVVSLSKGGGCGVESARITAEPSGHETWVQAWLSA